MSEKRRRKEYKTQRMGRRAMKLFPGHDMVDAHAAHSSWDCPPTPQQDLRKSNLVNSSMQGRGSRGPTKPLFSGCVLLRWPMPLWVAPPLCTCGQH